MALAGMLSALREIILEIDDLPQEELQRREFFTSRFGSLSPEEVHDLARVSPQQFKLYSSTVLNGESATLLTHFPLSFAILELASQEVYHTGLDHFQLAKKLQRSHPWKSTATDYLAATFVKFVPEEYAELVAIRPMLHDCLRLELATLRAKRALSAPPHRGAETGTGKTLAVQDLAALSVAELLSCAWTLSGAAGVERFEHDVIALWYSFHRQQKTLPPLEQVQKEVCYGCVCRDIEVSTRWMLLPAAVAELLQATKHGSIEDLAVAFLSTPELHGLPENEQFCKFILLIRRILELSAIHLVRTEMPAQEASGEMAATSA